MLKIDNIEKILAINSQDVEVMSWDWDNDYYTFDFVHDNIYSQIQINLNQIDSLQFENLENYYHLQQL